MLVLAGWGTHQTNIGLSYEPDREPVLLKFGFALAGW